MFSVINLALVVIATLVWCAHAATFYTAANHGGTDGVPNTITCPRNGVFTGIGYRSGTTSSVPQLSLRCSGIDFITTYGGYGNVQTETYLECPTGQYISSIFGKSGSKLDRLGIRCRRLDDMQSTGDSIGEVGGTGGTSFDDLSFSYNARPTTITVRASSSDVISIQVTYGNVPISGMANSNSWYNEVWAEKRGTSTSTMYSMSCPDEGVVNGITYRTGDAVDSLGFFCTSALGETYFGPYGGTGGSAGEEKCPPGSFIGSIHGKYDGNTLRNIGIRCVFVSEMQNPKQAFKRIVHGGGGSGTDFDDINFVELGRRPMEIKVWVDYSRISSIQVKYGNMPVSMNCRVSGIEVPDQNVVAERDGYEVVGVATRSNCQPIVQSLLLQSTLVVGNNVDLTTEEGGEFKWGTSVSVKFNATVGADVSQSISVDLEQSFNGSRSWSNSRLMSGSNETQSTIGTTVNFLGPGSCIAIGYLHRYKVNRDRVPVKYSFKCEVGQLSEQYGSIRLSSQMFGKMDFRNYCFTYNDWNVCKAQEASQDCVSYLVVNTRLSNLRTVRDSFYSCFDPYTGDTSRR